MSASYGHVPILNRILEEKNGACIFNVRSYVEIPYRAATSHLKFGFDQSSGGLVVSDMCIVCM